MSISKSEIKVIQDWVEEIVRINDEISTVDESTRWFDALSACKREGTPFEPNWDWYKKGENMKDINDLEKQRINLLFQFEEYLKTLMDE